MKLIPLTKGAEAIVDDEYFDILSQFKWYLSDTGYAVRRIRINGNTVTIRMHRFVNKTPDGMVVDHKNHNRLDNRKSNLRTVTQAENNDNRSGSKGYCFDKSKGLWMVRHNRKFYGRYKTEDEAKQAVRLARSGVPKKPGLHPRRTYLPPGVLYMQPLAQKNYAPYYIRPRINGKLIFKGYYGSINEALDALHELQAVGGLTS